MEFGKRHDTTDTSDFGTRQLVADLLRTCYGETGAMDFDIYRFVVQFAVQFVCR